MLSLAQLSPSLFPIFSHFQSFQISNFSPNFQIFFKVSKKNFQNIKIFSKFLPIYQLFQDKLILSLTRASKLSPAAILQLLVDPYQTEIVSRHNRSFLDDKFFFHTLSGIFHLFVVFLKPSLPDHTFIEEKSSLTSYSSDYWRVFYDSTTEILENLIKIFTVIILINLHSETILPTSLGSWNIARGKVSQNILFIYEYFELRVSQIFGIQTLLLATFSM